MRGVAKFLTDVPSQDNDSQSRDNGNLLMNSEKTYYVYILASKKNGVWYIGMTNDLERLAFYAGY
jgi:GIY-YIG catalytic domain